VKLGVLVGLCSLRLLNYVCRRPRFGFLVAFLFFFSIRLAFSCLRFTFGAFTPLDDCIWRRLWAFEMACCARSARSRSCILMCSRRCSTAYEYMRKTSKAYRVGMSPGNIVFPGASQSSRIADCRCCGCSATNGKCLIDRFATHVCPRTCGSHKSGCVAGFSILHNGVA